MHEKGLARKGALTQRLLCMLFKLQKNCDVTEIKVKSVGYLKCAHYTIAFGSTKPLSVPGQQFICDNRKLNSVVLEGVFKLMPSMKQKINIIQHNFPKNNICIHYFQCVINSQRLHVIFGRSLIFNTSLRTISSIQSVYKTIGTIFSIYNKDYEQHLQNLTNVYELYFQNLTKFYIYNSNKVSYNFSKIWDSTMLKQVVVLLVLGLLEAQAISWRNCGWLWYLMLQEFRSF